MALAPRSGLDWVRWVTWGYVAFIIAWVVARGLAADHLWWLALLNTDALALFLPLLALLPFTVWQRRPSQLAALMAPLVVFGWLYGDVVLPPLDRSSPTDPAIVAMTFNVLWSNQNYDRIVTAVRVADADLVALQELRPGHLQALVAELGTDYPYRAIHPTDPSIGLFSRFPIVATEPLPDPPFPRALLVRVRAGDRPLTVIVAHLTPTNMLDHGLDQLPTTVMECYRSRADQADGLLAAVRAAGQPAIVLCDCNLTDTSAAYARLRSELVDSFAVAGWGLRRTMLAPGLGWPAQRLDYVWSTAELRAVAAEVGQDGGSDHLPAIARLVWRERN
jgi:vancomycin resistance protein VanJ